MEGYYAHNGKAFMTSEKVVDTHIKLQDEVNTASEMLKGVKDFEETFHQSVLDAYCDISENILKTFRRKMPVSKVAMNWNVHMIKADPEF